jgi:peptidoglycan/LPS O-acetylase OafA/YrhL
MTAQQPHLSHPKYRPDIDGLRAIAVISVVIYHAFPNLLRGGFIGVDIFFVISGYLISTIIFENLDKGTFSFSDFYSRRIKRIFPALIVVLVAIYAFGWFALLADEYKQLGKHIGAGTIFISNFILWSEIDYFDNAAETKPLLHLWSLGIEEQFYILWPLLLWFAWRQKLNLFTLIIVIASISFYLNMRDVNNDPSATFFSPHTRFWELLCGSLIAWLSLNKNEHISKAVTNIDQALAAIIYRNRDHGDGNTFTNVVSFVGTFLLAYGIFHINSDLNFPGAWAAIPVLGAALIIIAGPASWVNRKILSNKVFIWFGLISYPLYLWHWPIFSFVRIIENEVISTTLQVILIVLSVILAWLTYKLIEQPLRFGKTNSLKAPVLVVLMTAIGILGLYTYKIDGLPARASIAEVTAIANDLKFDLERGKGWLCDDPAFKKLTYCYYEGKQPSIVIIGDSHAPRIYSGLREFYETQGESLGLFGGGGGCPPLLNLISKDNPGKDTRLCLERTNKALLRILKEDTIKEVILTSRGPLYTTGHGFGNFSGDKYTSWTLYLKGQEQGLRTNSDVYEIALNKTLSALLKAGKKVTYLYDVPELGFNIKSCAHTRPISITSKIRSPCSLKKEDFIERNKDFRLMTERVFKKYRDVRVIDLAEALCDENSCYGGKDGVLFYTDDDHLSHRGAKFVTEKIKEKLHIDPDL